MMKSNILQIIAIFSIVAMTLGACGGGGNDTPANEPTVTEPDPDVQAAADAIKAATMAALALSNSSDKAAVDAVASLITAAETAIAALPVASQAAETAKLKTARTLVDAQNARLEAEAEADRLATADAERKAAEARMAAEEMRKKAMKLYAGLEHGLGDTDNVRTGAYNTDEDGIDVTIGSAAVELSEDEDATVVTLHGWIGKRYTKEVNNMVAYEAVVYSNVGRAMTGDKFGQVGVTTAAEGYEYGLNAQGILMTDVETTPTVIASPSFNQSAGVKEFEKGTNREYVSISGTYHGVAGEYRCTPAAASTCAVQVAAEGFNLGGTADAGNAFTTGGGTWTFKPTNPETRVVDQPDEIYASYGWWLHTAEDGDVTASAFADVKDGVNDDGLPAAAALDTLQGTATYSGGAAGQYALHSTTGGTNDAGEFTARATLNANFGDDTITGTINNFVGHDGESRPWSVELKEQGVGTTGTILGDVGTGTAKMTVWTIDGTAAAAAGQWSGTLYDNGDDGVPKVGTGTFHSTYGNDGRMVGAFGVNKQ